MDGDPQGQAANDSSTIQPDRRPEILQPEVALTSALKAIAKLNRNTTWVATGLLGSVVFAAVMVAVRDPHPKTADVTEVAQPFKSDPSPSTNPTREFSGPGSTEKGAGEANSGQPTSVDFGLTPEPKHTPSAVAVNPSSSSPNLRPHLVRNARPKIPNLRHRSSIRSGTAPLNCGSSPCGAEACCGMKALAGALHRPAGIKSIRSKNHRDIKKAMNAALAAHPCRPGSGQS
jgi:hypothetical protein